MIAAADRELVGCAHRLVEWMTPMPDGVVSELRERGWMATPLIFMLHDGRAVPEGLGSSSKWTTTRCGSSATYGIGRASASTPRPTRSTPGPRGGRARRRACDSGDRAGARDRIRPGGDPRRRQRGDPGVRAPGVPRRRPRRCAHRAGHSRRRDAAPEVWICAERDDRPRRLYERLGFRAVVETGDAILPPKP